MVKAIGIGLLAKRVAFRNTSDCLTCPKEYPFSAPKCGVSVRCYTGGDGRVNEYVWNVFVRRWANRSGSQLRT